MASRASQKTPSDPRDMLSDWANHQPRWVRSLVRQALATRGPVDADGLAQAHRTFRLEHGFDEGELPEEPPLPARDPEAETSERLVITSLSQVAGVNALSGSSEIEPHPGLTILFGENGTGKTGYSRIFKALANSHGAETILGDIRGNAKRTPSARIRYQLDGVELDYAWSGEKDVTPFNRIAVFDSSTLQRHLDTTAKYSYTPVAFQPFGHVINAIKEVQERAKGDREALLSHLRRQEETLFSSFPPDSETHALLRGLRTSADLETLRSLADFSSDAQGRLEQQRIEIAKLKTQDVREEIRQRSRDQRALRQALDAATALREFDIAAYHRELAERDRLQDDRRVFRANRFTEIPASSSAVWEAFVQAGKTYQDSLIAQDAYDANLCSYCWQPLNTAAQALIARYGGYLEDKINNDIESTEARLLSFHQSITSIPVEEARILAEEHHSHTEAPSYLSALRRALARITALAEHLSSQTSIDTIPDVRAETDFSQLSAAHKEASDRIDQLLARSQNHNGALAAHEQALASLETATKLAKLWPDIERYITDANQADLLEQHHTAMSELRREVTKTSKEASEKLLNTRFKECFEKECVELRLPEVTLSFEARDGQAQRRRRVGPRNNSHTPSKILSEGEQKVVAMADFLAEVQVFGATAPVVFDDPVTSLDHRRIKRVAKRIADISHTTQVIVFTHDIFLATILLDLTKKEGDQDPDRRSYFQITDEKGKGVVLPSGGPRWDDLDHMTNQIKGKIEEARNTCGDERAEKIIRSYNLIRSWCEVFVEKKLLNGVAKRYQPNIAMGNLKSIKIGALPDAFEVINEIFHEACRYIDAHSQPAPTLYVRPSLQDLEEHWEALAQAQRTHKRAPS